jgi:predicted porin
MWSETGVIGYWTNLSMVRAELVLRPTNKSKLSFWYNYLMANETATGSLLSGTSKDRGQMPQARLDYAFNKNVSGYILAEYFIPGDYYKTKDEALFLRTELQIKF